LAAGAHRLHVSQNGYVDDERSFDLGASPTPLPLRVDLVPIRVAAPAPSSSDAWIWVGAGGVATLVGGAVLFGVGRSYVDRVEDVGRRQTAEEAEADRSRGLWYTAFGTGLAAVGVAGLTTAVILRLTRPERPSSSWNYQVGPGRVTVSGTF
jgi:hypothetical protein